MVQDHDSRSWTPCFCPDCESKRADYLGRMDQSPGKPGELEEEQREGPTWQCPDCGAPATHRKADSTGTLYWLRYECGGERSPCDPKPVEADDEGERERPESGKAVWMGVPLEDRSRAELYAIIEMQDGWVENTRKAHAHERDVLSGKEPDDEAYEWHGAD